MTKNKKYCGCIAIVGRSNVGKSSLFNELVKKKISITSRKPHTTRHRIIGIKTHNEYQSIYMDTPGIYIKDQTSLNRLINSTISKVINDAELVIFVVESTRWKEDDEKLLEYLKIKKSKIVLVINKIDCIKKKDKLLTHIKFLSEKIQFLEIIPLSVKKRVNLDILERIVQKNLPESKHLFPEKYISLHSKYFFVSEIIREKLIRFLWKELPYSVSVRIESFFINHQDNYYINGLVLVEKEEQKKIVIGKNGKKIKMISIESKKDIQKYFQKSINIKLWVKVKPRWSKDNDQLRSF